MAHGQVRDDDALSVCYFGDMAADSTAIPVRIVADLFPVSFSRRPFAEKREIIDRGRPTNA